MSARPTALEQLRAELVHAAVVRHQRRMARRRAGRSAAALLVVAALVATSVGAAGHRAARAEARVERRGGRVVLLLVDLEHDPRRIEEALAGAGIRARVEAVPVGPSLVGRFVDQAQAGGAPDLELLDSAATGCSFAGFSVPEGWTGELHLRVGRPAVGDEPYTAFADALDPGEPLAGRAIVGRWLADAERALAGDALTSDVEVIDGSSTAVLPLAVAARGDHAGWVVASATATARRHVLLRAVPPGRTPPPDRAC